MSSQSLVNLNYDRSLESTLDQELRSYNDRNPSSGLRLVSQSTTPSSNQVNSLQKEVSSHFAQHSHPGTPQHQQLYQHQHQQQHQHQHQQQPQQQQLDVAAAAAAAAAASSIATAASSMGTPDGTQSAHGGVSVPGGNQSNNPNAPNTGNNGSNVGSVTSATASHHHSPAHHNNSANTSATTPVRHRINKPGQRFGAKKKHGYGIGLFKTVKIPIWPHVSTALKLLEDCLVIKDPQKSLVSIWKLIKSTRRLQIHAVLHSSAHIIILLLQYLQLLEELEVMALLVGLEDLQIVLGQPVTTQLPTVLQVLRIPLQLA